MIFRSIKTKVTLVVTGAFMALLVLGSAIEMYRVKASLGGVLGAQQLTLVTRVADEIDDKLKSTHGALIALAKSLSPAIAADPARLRGDLEKLVVLQSLFDGLFAFSRDGTYIVELPVIGAAGRSVADREYFQETVRERRPVISRPHISRVLGAPAVTLTAPILDERGEVVAILAGTLNLLNPNFLGKLATAPIGKTGQFELIGRDRTIIISRDRARIMTPGPQPGVSPYFDHAVARSEGWEENVNSRGLHDLFSYSPLATVPWMLVAALPVEEAFAPVVAARRYIAGLTIVLIIVLAPIVWLGTAHLMAPLITLRDAIRRIREDPGRVAEVPVRSNDEIGDLAADFSALMRERNDATAALLDSQRQLSLALEGSQLALFDWNVETGEVFLGERWAVMMGGRLEPTRTTFAELEQRVHPDDKNLVGRSIRNALRGASSHYRVDHRVSTDDGRWLWIQSHGQVTKRDHMGRAQRMIGTNADITDRKGAEQALAESRAELERAALHDSLTGLPNRRVLSDRVGQALARVRRSQHIVAILCLDIDLFKTINDTWGHAAGDAVLKEFSVRLRRCARASDTVARLGGDEFVVLLEDLRRPEDAHAIAEKIVDAMREDFHVDLIALRVTTSIGIACAKGPATEEELLRRADAALYEAKRAGRNRFHVAASPPETSGDAVPAARQA